MTSAPPPAPPSVQPAGDAWPPPPDPPARPALRRSRSDRVAGGVAGGLADYSGIDALLWRIGFVALAFAGGSGVLVYLLLWLLMPAGPRQPGAGPAARAPAGPRSPVARLTLAGVLIVVGLLALLARTTDLDPGPHGFLGAALLVVGLGLVAAAFSRGRTAKGGLIALGVVLSLALLLASAAPWHEGWHEGVGVGDRTYRPASVAEVDDVYRGGAGNMTVDLTRIDVGDIHRPLRIEVDHGVGGLEVLLPREADVQLDLDSGVGAVDVFGGGSADGGYFRGTGSGAGVGDDEAEIVLSVRHGVGDVEVARA